MIVTADCLDHLRTLPDDSIESCVTDPPYGLGAPPPIEDVLRAWLAGEVYRPKGRGFMGKAWDAFVPCPEVWREVHRVLRPGSHLLAFFGTRTFDVGVLAIRLAGFEIRDEIAWLYGSGFPKSLDVSKAIDKAAGAEREVVGSKMGRPGYSLAESKGGNLYGGGIGGTGDPRREAEITAPATPEAARWEGWGTALKPAHEPIVVARKPFRGTVAQNVLTHGTGAYNVGACRIGTEPRVNPSAGNKAGGAALRMSVQGMPAGVEPRPCEGRWPANVALDEGAAEMLDAQTGRLAGRGNKGPSRRVNAPHHVYGMDTSEGDCGGRFTYDAGGGASRFFYVAKASKAERDAGPTAKNAHPTVKPVALMRWLVRLVTPPGGTVLDPFAGSGTTGVAAALEGLGFLGVEREAEYAEIARARIAGACGPTAGVLDPGACDSSDSSETE